MRKKRIIGLGLGLMLVIVACSNSGDATLATPATHRGTSASDAGQAPGATTVAATPATNVPSEEDLAIFVATIEELLVGTVYEGGALEQPELFLATGFLFCDWLDKGADADTALSRYLEELAGEAASASDEQLVVAGALLGAAVAVLCPEHTQSIVQD